MKNLILALFLIFTASSCVSQKNTFTNSTEIEYTANTRGFYQKITIQNQKAMVFKNRNNSEKPSVIAISDSEWRDFLNYFESINLDKLATLKAPTEKRFYDGAAIANLKIVYKDKIYETTSFDHGHPPEEIKDLVNKINSFAKKDTE